MNYVEQSLTIDGETLPIFTNLKSLKTKTTSDHNLAADELLIQVQSDISRITFNTIIKKSFLSFLFQVVAEDQDLGFNSQLVYVITSGD